MKHYLVTGRVFEVPAYSRIGLTPEQYGNRRHAVRKIAEGIYETLVPVQFKNGEQVLTDLDVGKAQMVEVIPVTAGGDPALAAEVQEKAPEKKGRSRG